jgi:hypothetical protein
MTRFRNPGFYQKKHYAELYESMLDTAKRFDIELQTMIRREASPLRESFICHAFIHWVQINLVNFLTENFKDKESWGEVERLYHTLSKVVSEHSKYMH